MYREQKYIPSFVTVYPRGKHLLKVLCSDRRITLKYILKGHDFTASNWIHPAQDRGTWWDVVSPVWKSWSLYNIWNFRTN